MYKEKKNRVTLSICLPGVVPNYDNQQSHESECIRLQLVRHILKLPTAASQPAIAAKHLVCSVTWTLACFY